MPCLGLANYIITLIRRHLGEEEYDHLCSLPMDKPESIPDANCPLQRQAGEIGVQRLPLFRSQKGNSGFHGRTQFSEQSPPLYCRR